MRLSSFSGKVEPIDTSQDLKFCSVKHISIENSMNCSDIGINTTSDISKLL